MPIKHPCAREGCNTYTANRFYCSRSCSATVNNQREPKRTRSTRKVTCRSCGHWWYIPPSRVAQDDLCITCRREKEYATLEERMKMMTDPPSILALVAAGLKARVCESCGLDTWLEQPITLEREHVDGDRHNNALENLKLLCPNCHAQTPTWRRSKTKNTWSQRSLVYATCSCGGQYTERWTVKKHVKELGHEVAATWCPWHPTS